jgi:hypothetical protein
MSRYRLLPLMTPFLVDLTYADVTAAASCFSA